MLPRLPENKEKAFELNSSFPLLYSYVDTSNILIDIILNAEYNLFMPQ